MVNKSEPAGSSIDFVILADRAEVINGKLYMMGGCWDRLQLPEFPISLPVGLAVRVLMPADDFREDHRLDIAVLGQEGARFDPPLVRFLRQPIPPDMAVVPGVVGLGGLVSVPGPGEYEVQVTLDGLPETRRIVSFRVESVAPNA